MWLLAILGILDIFINAERHFLLRSFHFTASWLTLLCLILRISALSLLQAASTDSRLSLNPDYLCKSADQE